MIAYLPSYYLNLKLECLSMQLFLKQKNIVNIKKYKILSIKKIEIKPMLFV